MPRSKPKAHRLAPPTPQPRPILETTQTKNPITTLIRANSLPSPEQQHPSSHSAALGPSTVNPDLDPAFTRASTDLSEPRQIPPSCSSSDTVSVGVADHINELDLLEIKPQALHGKSSTSTAAKNSGKRKRNQGAVHSNVPTSREINYSGLKDEEVKSISADQPGNIISSKTKLSHRQIDKDNQRDYWEETGTLSIRKSNQTGKISGRVLRKTIERTGNKAPSLSPDGIEISLLKTNHNASREIFSHGNLCNRLTKPNLEDGLHPITEENLDGGDPIPIDEHRKKKLARRFKSSVGSAHLSSGQGGRKSAPEKRTNKRSERKQVHVPIWRSHDKTIVVESVDVAETSHDVRRSGTRRNEKCKHVGETACSTGLSESEGQACMRCGSHGKASKMVLCDVCSDGCHTFCMRPSRTSVPLGVWICPRCHALAKKNEIPLSQLGDFLASRGL